MNNNDQNIPIAEDEKNDTFRTEYFKIFSDLAESAIDASPSEDATNILFMQMAGWCMQYIFLKMPNKFPGLLSIILASLGTFGERDQDNESSEDLNPADDYENIMPSHRGSDWA